MTEIASPLTSQNPIAARLLGMRTARTCIWTTYESPFGKLTLCALDGPLGELHFAGRAPTLEERDHGPERFVEAIAQLNEYFAGTRRQFELELDLSAGTSFQRDVWRELTAIPYGETSSYGHLAAVLGRPDRARAVGAAVGRNPLPIIIPCHRVVGADGSLTGYVGGLHRKQALLDTERAVHRGNGAAIEFGARQLALL
ncbi:MAG: methylated-DNA--[protein]-cysteine S-methyltransferase [Acidobacteriota bacterium]|nr:methylated-DNA--[protein]-cysteine S-methyltransferase [Acidobacteriota bacterium]